MEGQKSNVKACSLTLAEHTSLSLLVGKRQKDACHWSLLASVGSNSIQHHASSLPHIEMRIFKGCRHSATKCNVNIRLVSIALSRGQQFLSSVLNFSHPKWLDVVMGVLSTQSQRLFGERQ